jgi:hypothetical protein
VNFALSISGGYAGISDRGYSQNAIVLQYVTKSAFCVEVLEIRVGRPRKFRKFGFPTSEAHKMHFSSRTAKL